MSHLSHGNLLPPWSKFDVLHWIVGCVATDRRQRESPIALLNNFSRFCSRNHAIHLFHYMLKVTSAEYAQVDFNLDCNS